MKQGILLLFLMVGLKLNAQNLVAQQEAGKTYLNHTVAAKENWYSIGRMYNISPREIAPFNGTSMEKSLAIGQKLKVPLTSVNLAQSGQPAPDEVFVPVYHTVKAQEGLFRIGQNYNKVSVDQLKAWNKLKTDQTPVGTNLIVGYLRVKRDLSPLASVGVTNVQNQPVAKTTAAPPAETPKATPVQAPVKTTPAQTAADPTANVPPAKKETTPPAPKTEPAASKNITGTSVAEGAFGALFMEQSKGNPSNSVTGQAASFKSTSGWKDGKYYVLMNKVSPGTIVRITVPGNNKSVYAKVLGEIPAGKENEGLLVRVSNAALAQLEVAEGRFDVQLQY
ncbi:MAG TPA: LysM peptidoglycan-binding domain-containing protein [Chitinophagaceae bacterium]|nr:LysM peptidoglycan-binding domain-containing protein [Chitinophagaceae bacterium]